MKPTIQLINALRKAADRIETNPSCYSWWSDEQCNCGLVCAELLGRPVSAGGSWHAAANRCRASGMEHKEVFRELAACGLVPRDFSNLESLGDAEVAARIGLRVFEVGPDWTSVAPEHSGNPKTVIQYLRAQADILEEQLGEQFETRPIELTARQPLIESTRELVR